MVLQSNQERVKALLKDTITLLCKNGLDFKNKFNIEALIGVTVDDSDVFLISMNEVVKLDAAGTPSAAVDDETDPAQSSVVPTPDLSLPQAQSKGNFQQRNQKQVEIKHEPINPLSDHAYLNISNIQTEVSVHEHGTSQAKRRRTDFETSNVVEIKPSQNSKNQQIVFVKEEVVDSPALDQQSVTTDSPNVVYSMKDSLEDSVWSQSVLGPEPGECLQSTAEVIPSSNSQSDPQPGSSGQSDPQPGSSEQSRLHPQPESSLSSVKQPQETETSDSAELKIENTAMMSGVDEESISACSSPPLNSIKSEDDEGSASNSVQCLTQSGEDEEPTFNPQIYSVKSGEDEESVFNPRIFSVKSGDDAEPAFNPKVHSVKSGEDNEPGISVPQHSSTPTVPVSPAVLMSGKKKFKCDICSSAFASKASVLRHKKKHDGTMVHCTVADCTRKFYDGYELKQHIETAHQGVPIECQYCGKRFLTKAGLARHSQSHTGEYKYTCEMCGRGFAYFHLYSEHVNVHHDLKPYRCFRCNAAFPRKCNFDFHVSICGKDAGIQCEICGKNFKARRYMIDHMRTHTSPTKYQCRKCGKEYPHRTSLKYHESQKHGL